MKKLIYGTIICIIVIGIILTLTIGFNVGFPYSKSISIDVYIGQKFDSKDIEQIAKEVFANQRVVVQKVELFEDMAGITINHMKEEDLNPKLEELNTKINEKYGIENETKNLTIRYNPKIKLTSIIKPYITPIIACTILILIYMVIKYRKLGIIKVLLTSFIWISVLQALYASLLVITRIPINRLIVPIALILYILTVTGLCIKNDRELV